MNDPATAVQVLDVLEDLLDRAAAADTEPLRLVDSDGELRIVIPLPGFDNFVRTGLDDIIAAATASPMTLNRLHILLVRVQSRSGPIHHQLLTARLAWVDELAGHFTYLRPPPGDDGPLTTERSDIQRILHGSVVPRHQELRAAAAQGRSQTLSPNGSRRP